MSPRNWRDCPRCLAKAELDHLAAKQELADLYGSIDQEEYERQKAMLDGNGTLSHETMREDYDIGVEDSGKFMVNFGCYCEKCGFEFQFKHKEKIDLTIPDRKV